MPDPREILPEVQVSTYGSWDELAGWWWNLVKEQYDVSDVMREHFRERLAAAKTRQEKIRAIYDFVVSDVRYVDWEFGVHGYKPYRTSAIFDRRFGDCKDKALLISALLKDVGIPAYPVLIRLDDQRPEEDLTLPLGEHFNHCIAAELSEDGKSYQFLDGTAEYHSADDCPDGDRGAKVIVVRDGRADPQQIPTATPDENGQDETVAVAMRKDGAASIDYAATARGHHAVQIRATYVNEADRKEQLTAGVNRRFWQGEFGKITFSKLDDLSAPVSMSYRFEVADALTRDGNRSRLKPLWPPLDWTSITVTETRRFDILLGAPSRVATTSTVTLPPKMKAAEIPTDVVIDQPFARYELKREAADGKIVFHRLLILKQPRVKAADYAAFKQFVWQVAAAEMETATIEESR